jgi:hypothetical protein
MIKNQHQPWKHERASEAEAKLRDVEKTAPAAPETIPQVVSELNQLSDAQNGEGERLQRILCRLQEQMTGGSNPVAEGGEKASPVLPLAFIARRLGDQYQMRLQTINEIERLLGI